MEAHWNASLGLAAIVVTACVSPAEQKAADTKQCQGYGFTPGSDAFASCMMTITNRRADQMRHWQEEQNRQWQEQQKPAQATPTHSAEPTAMDCTTTETSTTTGNTTNVQSRTNCRSR
jgi:hypothetical protein